MRMRYLVATALVLGGCTDDTPTAQTVGAEATDVVLQDAPDAAPDPPDAGADAPDAGADSTDTVPGAPDVGPAPSRCNIVGDEMSCAYETITLLSGITGLAPRDVHFQTPLGEPPAAGWPVAIIFQGSIATASLNWVGVEDGPFGMWHQVDTTRALLDGGYAVLTPEAKLGGATFWDTNVPPFSVLWEQSSDHQLVLDLLAGIEEGTFGALDPTRLYAGGISSGGYMSSRFAITYPNVRAIAVHSASYAACAGPVCVVPELPEEHPPTLFLHGGLDPVVPIWTMELYRDALVGQGTAVEVLLEPAAQHEWIPAAPGGIVGWFDDHP